jgi:hypothetical protein
MDSWSPSDTPDLAASENLGLPYIEQPTFLWLAKSVSKSSRFGERTAWLANRF